MSVDIGSYIVRTPGTVGGRPRIDGTRVTVQAIAVCYKQGDSPEEIAFRYGYLSAAQVYAALAYYHANRDEIEAGIAAEAELYEQMVRADQQAKQATLHILDS
jgi:uncharacterized protein (DUF433 family)